MMRLRDMSREDLEALFEERKRALIEVRDELDRRDREKRKEHLDWDYCQYVTE